MRGVVLLTGLATMILVACESSNSITCRTTVYDETGAVVAADTESATGNFAACDGRVYLDSVGSDPTPAVTYRFDSVAGDPTPD